MKSQHEHWCGWTLRKAIAWPSDLLVRFYLTMWLSQPLLYDYSQDGGLYRRLWWVKQRAEIYMSLVFRNTEYTRNAEGITLKHHFAIILCAYKAPLGVPNDRQYPPVRAEAGLVHAFCEPRQHTLKSLDKGRPELIPSPGQCAHSLGLQLCSDIRTWQHSYQRWTSEMHQLWTAWRYFLAGQQWRVSPQYEADGEPIPVGVILLEAEVLLDLLCQLSTFEPSHVTYIWKTWTSNNRKLTCMAALCLLLR